MQAALNEAHPSSAFARHHTTARKSILADREKKRLRYWEGEWPPHAWLTINGKVVDVTREAADRRLREMGHELPQEERAYLNGAGPSAGGCWYKKLTLRIPRRGSI
jgi:hypothetical protein